MLTLECRERKWHLSYSATQWRMATCAGQTQTPQWFTDKGVYRTKIMSNGKGFSVVGCVNWSVLMHASATIYSAPGITCPGLHDYGQVVSNRRRSLYDILGLWVSDVVVRAERKEQGYIFHAEQATFFCYLKQSIPSETCFTGRPTGRRRWLYSSAAMTLKKG